MDDKERDEEIQEEVQEEEPTVYAVKKDLTGWRFDRRTFLAAAGATAAVAAVGTTAGCGGQKPVVLQVTETASPVPPTATLASESQGSTSSDQPAEPIDTATPTEAAAQPPTPEPQPEATTATVPTEVPSPEPTEATPKAEFVKDVTIPDGTLMKKQEAFTKTWRYRNNGEVPWGEGVKLVWVEGTFQGYDSQKMGGPDSLPVPDVAPGDATNISVDLRAPNKSGRFRSYWRLQLPNGEWLEKNHYVEVLVEPPTATQPPPPTNTPVPACGCDGHCDCDGDCGCDGDCRKDEDSHYWHPN